MITDFDIFRTILFLCWMTAWLAILSVGSLLVMGLFRLIDLVRAWWHAPDDEPAIAYGDVVRMPWQEHDYRQRRALVNDEDAP